MHEKCACAVHCLEDVLGLYLLNVELYAAQEGQRRLWKKFRNSQRRSYSLSVQWRAGPADERVGVASLEATAVLVKVRAPPN
jgi:hypothetical protein